MRRLSFSLVLFGGLAIVSFKSALAQDSKLIEAAKKEGGRMVVYGSLKNDTMDLISAAFKKKTGLDVDFWRDSANKVTDRVGAEFRAGKPQVDVVLTTTSTMQLAQKDGLLAKYDSPAAKAFPKNVVDPNLGPAYRSTVIGVVYNTGIIKPSEAPKSLEDLAKPQYQGKVVFPDPSQHTTTAQWLASLHKIMGVEKANKFIHDFAATKPLLVPSLTPAGERITTGETPIGVAFLKNVVFYGRKGVPLDYVRLGKFIGEESLKIMANIGEFVTRKGIYPPLPDANKIQLVDMIDMDKEAFAQKMAEYKKIFLQQ